MKAATTNLQSPVFPGQRRSGPAETCAGALGREGGFSLIEMMITVALLGFIVVGLMAMFIQTQRAFRGGMAQTDVLEAGRAVADLLARELELAAPANLAHTNFFVQPRQAHLQTLTGSSASRVNVIGAFYFLNRDNLNWTGIGYLVGPETDGVGTLYRYETNAPVSQVPGIGEFFSLNPNTADRNPLLHRVADGIVHLRLVAYATNGVKIGLNLPNTWTNAINTGASLGEISYVFTSNAVPVSLELEVGVLENQTLKKLEALPTAAARASYLQRPQTAGRVHIFRRHIAVRNVDPEAYR